VWDARALIADEKWMATYQRLIAYNKQHHTTSVPRCYQEDRQLAIWVTIQRQSYQNNELSVERIKYLESLGFVWKMRDVVPWMEMYERLVAYQQCHQSTLVPQRYTEDLRLGSWVKTQRKSNKKGKLSEKRIELLNAIDFVWSGPTGRPATPATRSTSAAAMILGNNGLPILWV